MKMLFAASEAYPLIKTGGLADVAGSLPEVLRQQGVDVRLFLPAYADVLADLVEPPGVVAELDVSGTPVHILETELPGTGLVTWLLQHPMFSERPGNPYHDGAGHPWPDNADRFLLFCRTTALIATADTALGWRPDVLHGNDWHTGPAIALAHLYGNAPKTVFTIHNLAHMGLFDKPTFERLQLPWELWGEHGMEFYGQCSYMKAGLAYADHITTVSPSYAEEICHSPGGMGLEGLLSHRRERLVGILNGIDNSTWNPSSDAFLAYHYDAEDLSGKARNKAALQEELGLERRDDCPLLGFVGRLAEQKGLELLLPLLDEFLDTPAQLVFLGTGERSYEQRLQDLSRMRPESMAVVLAYNEGLAHRIEAGADIFLMPSLFEPCGLNQLYSLRYGTLPVVRGVGGLADTVVDADDEARASGTATGFVFRAPYAADLRGVVRRAADLWHDKVAWRALQVTAMAQDFSWHQSAKHYLELYRSKGSQI